MLTVCVRFYAVPIAADGCHDGTSAVFHELPPDNISGAIAFLTFKLDLHINVLLYKCFVVFLYEIQCAEQFRQFLLRAGIGDVQFFLQQFQVSTVFQKCGKKQVLVIVQFIKGADFKRV